MTSNLFAAGVAAALTSALTQAVSHGSVKAGRDKLVVRGLTAATCALAVAPLLPFVEAPGVVLLSWLVVSVGLHVAYQLVLIRAYEAEDFSVAHPLARGVAPAFTAIIASLWLGQPLSPTAVVGVVCVTFGLTAIGLRGAAKPAAAAAALVAGLLTAAYTVVDAHAVRLPNRPATFIVWFFVAEAMGMVPLVLALRQGRIIAAAREDARPGVIAGVSALVGYGLALFSLRILPSGAASALRETSIIFGAALARFALKEKLRRGRLVGIGLTALGGVLVVAGL
jgi:drug/metabolite transporter (DMT)-like permease